MEPCIRGTTAEFLRFECDLILRQWYICPVYFTTDAAGIRLIIKNFVLYSLRLRLLAGAVWEFFARLGVMGLYKKDFSMSLYGLAAL